MDTRLVDTVIDVIDPTEMRRVATLRMDELASFFLPGPRVTVWNEDDYAVDVKALSIVR